MTYWSSFCICLRMVARTIRAWDTVRSTKLDRHCQQSFNWMGSQQDRTILALNHHSLTQNYFVCKFMTAVFNQRPALPRTNVTWDTSVVLDLLKKWAPVKSLDLKRLSQKLTMLLLLLAGQRGQTIHMFDVRNMHHSCILPSLW